MSAERMAEVVADMLDVEWQNGNITGEAADRLPGSVAAALHEAGFGDVAAAKAEALREAADAWQINGWADVLLPKPAPPAVPVIAYAQRVTDWLRGRVDQVGGAS